MPLWSRPVFWGNIKFLKFICNLSRLLSFIQAARSAEPEPDHLCIQSNLSNHLFIHSFTQLNIEHFFSHYENDQRQNFHPFFYANAILRRLILRICSRYSYYFSLSNSSTYVMTRIFCPSLLVSRRVAFDSRI